MRSSVRCFTDISSYPAAFPITAVKLSSTDIRGACVFPQGFSMPELPGGDELPP